MVDGRVSGPEQWTAERVQAVCDRRAGVGADGVAVLLPGSRSDAVRFEFFNRDGSRAAMCGNAALCATRLACWLEMVPGDRLTLETDVGPVEARCVAGEGERAEIGLPEPEPVSSAPIPVDEGERSIYRTVVGVPHLVVLVEDISGIPLLERGGALRSHPAAGPEGANVNFVAPAAHGWVMRTYERGVEAETLACGTGAVASAAVLAQANAIQLPWEVATSSGAILTVSARPGQNGALRQPRLAGEGRLVFRAVLGS